MAWDLPTTNETPAASGKHSAGRWDLSQGPVLLAGADGNVHETRPTVSLARDLAQAEENQPRVLPLGGSPASRDSRPSLSSLNRAKVEERPARVNPDDRPLRPMHGAAAIGPRSPGGSGLGYGGGGSSPSAARLKASKSTPSVNRPSVGGAGRSSTGGGASPGIGLQRRSLRPYAPLDTLLNMGFDEEAARAAVAAAGGDVDRAVRLVLEDARAHDAVNAAEWEFDGDAGWAPFDPETDAILSAAASRGKSACEVQIDGRRYLVDFDSFTQLNLASNKGRRIRRRHESASASSSAPAPEAP